MNNRFSRAMHGYMCNKKCVCFFKYVFQFMLYYKSKYSKSVKFVSISWNPLIKIRLVYLSIEYCRGRLYWVICRDSPYMRDSSWDSQTLFAYIKPGNNNKSSQVIISFSLIKTLFLHFKNIALKTYSSLHKPIYQY